MELSSLLGRGESFPWEDDMGSGSFMVNLVNLERVVHLIL